MKNQKTFGMVVTAFFMAVILVMAFVPNLGYINLILIHATLIHVPVIIGSIVLGPKKGAFLGAVFGITSVVNATFLNPSLLSFAFSPFYSVGGRQGNFFSLVVALAPRILVGIVPYYVYTGIVRLRKTTPRTGGARAGKGASFPKAVALPLACVLGSATNTLLVMHLIYLGFRDEFASAKSIALEAVYGSILGIIAANGIPEAIVAALLGTAVCMVLLKLLPQKTGKHPAHHTDGA